MTEKEAQEKMKTARTSDWYDSIWKTVGKCVFCDLKDKYILYEENGIVLTVSLYPYIDGHLLIIPRNHIISLKELSEAQWATVRKYTYIARKLFKKVHNVSNMWVLTREGGQEAQMTVDHLHIHLIPFKDKEMCTWHYKELKYTPLENVNNYGIESKEFVQLYEKYSQKYQSQSTVPVVVDAIIQNEKGEILFQNRAKEAQIYPNLITLPGGHIDNYKNTLIENLIDEVKEETGLTIESDGLTLVNSEISSVKYVRELKQDKKKFLRKDTFLWNTYIYSKNVDEKLVKCSSDCKSAIWVKIEDVEKHKDISKEVKELISKTFDK